MNDRCFFRDNCMTCQFRDGSFCSVNKYPCDKTTDKIPEQRGLEVGKTLTHRYSLQERKVEIVAAFIPEISPVRLYGFYEKGVGLWYTFRETIPKLIAAFPESNFTLLAKCGKCDAGFIHRADDNGKYFAKCHWCDNGWTQAK